jgi:methyl-accepting chemotaxis protein
VKYNQMGLRIKFIIVMSMLLIMTGSLLSWFFLSRTKTSLEEQLKRRGILLTENLASNSTYGLTIGDIELLNQLIKQLSGISDVAYVMIINRSGQVVAHSDAAEVNKSYSDAPSIKALGSQEALIQFLKIKDEEVYDIAVPVVFQENKSSPQVLDESVLIKGGHIGVVRVGLSLHDLNEELQRTLSTGIFLTLLVVGFGVAISAFFIRLVVSPLGRIANLAVKVADGDFTQKMDIDAKDEIGLLAQTFTRMSDNLSDMIKKVQEVSSHILSASQKIGDSSARVFDGTRVQATSTEKTLSSVEEMNASIKEIVDSVYNLSSSTEETSASILQMSSSIGEVANTTAGLASSVDDTSSSITQMSSSIREVAENVETLSSAAEETASAINEISITLREIESHSKESAKLSERVSSNARDLGMPSIEKTIEGMNKIQDAVVKSSDIINLLGDRSEQIGKILTVIHEVTRQTNLLALNAAILAAQAGEHGKGFTVVAGEIKNLADRTASSTKEITQLIGNVQSGSKDAVKSIKEGAKNVEEGVELSLEAGDALKKILESAGYSTEMARKIEHATVEQSNGVRLVTEAMERINMMVQQIARATHEQSKGSEKIMLSSEKMRDMTQRVKISTEEQARGSREITKAAENVTGRVEQIARGVDTQKQGTEVIVRSMGDIQRIASENVSLVSGMNKAVDTLTEQARLLKREMDKFRVEKSSG